ncbi:hypothetical protein CANMA_003090 [Candida margitis]|uniref:uncharacterized protein n=1 Tax=Candida margitis TaxID=1775924 RepID=UPI002225CC44|nr:uncharacterized protein CANMA_003090 [Candida margitis]KAI5967270.1 hypothetical protein CANMA_003090 [Candida margitis]
MYVEHRSQIQQPTSHTVHESLPHSFRHSSTTTTTNAAPTYHPIMYPPPSSSSSSSSTSPKPSSPNNNLPKLQTSGFTNYQPSHASASTITPSSSATTHLHPSSATSQASPSKTSPILDSDNKICQWYCCSCGQSYGSVLYKDDYIQQEGFIERPEATSTYRTEKPPTQSTRNYIFDSLKYYSQVVYRDHKHVLSNSPTLVKTDNYFECKQGQPNSHPHSQEQKKQTDQSEDMDCPQSPKLNPHTPLISPLHLDLNSNANSLIEYQDRAILSIPNRFTCHRCNHMMCPYCLKLRLKDI